MTEARKIQLEVGVDSTGAKEGLDQVKQGIRDTAQVAVQEGQRASKGIEAIGDGIKKAADGFSREEGRIRASILRTTAELKSFSAAASDKIEARINLQGLDASKFQPYIAALKEVEAEQRRVLEQKQSSGFIDGLRLQAEAIGKSRADLLAMDAAQRGLSKEAAPYIAKLKEAEAGHRNLAAGAKLSAFQTQQLGFQMHDFVVQVASGQSALTAFVQQGSQLSGTFGGAGNALKAVATLITPVRVALLGAAAAAGGIALALSHAETAARGLNTLQAQLSGTGRSDLFSTDQLKEFIKELSLAPGVTRETATSIVSELSKVQGIGGELFRDLAKSAADYAKATGTDVPTAAKALARAFQDPEKGAKQLDDALGSLTSTQIIAIERLSKAGDIAGAQRVLFDALQGSVKGLADNAMTPLQKSVNDLGNAWEGAMTKLDRSEGLRTINTLLAKTIDGVRFLVNNADKLGGIGNFAVASIPGVGAPAAIANAIRAPFTSKEQKSTGGATGSFDTPGGATGSFGAAKAVAAKTGGDDEIKRALEAAKSYKGQAYELSELATERKRFNSALQESIKLYGAESDQAQRLRGAVAGVDEKIASVKKRGQKSGGNEAQQVLDAQLQQSVSGARDALERERDAMAFSQRFLQGVYQAGELSLKDFYTEQTKTIERGTAAKIAALEEERAAVEKHLAATKRTSPKDTSAIVKDETRLKDIDADIGKVRVEGQRQVVLSNQDAAASFKALDEQVLQYQASLKTLQGDEIGAARIRDEIARKQLAVLAKQSQDSSSPITANDQADFATAQRQVQALNEVKTKTSAINAQLQIEEERIALAMKTGSIGEIDALQALGSTRAKAVAELEKVVKAQEEVAKSRPEDYQLQIDTSRARLELDKLKSELDPLKEKFDNLFKDAGAGLFADLMNGTKPKDALKNFGATISKELSSIASKQLSEQVFGKGGIFGGLGGEFAKMVGGKDKPTVDTSGVQQSFSTLQSAGIDPTVSAFQRLIASIDSAANSSLGRDIRIPNPSGDTTTLPTGDFARMDRTTGEDQVMDLFRDAGKSNEDYAKTSAQAASSVLQFASAASRGGSALSLLPSIISSIQAAASSGGANVSGFGSLFGGSTSANAFGGASSAGFGTGAGFGNMDYGMFFSDGGYTGRMDPKKVAGVVHGEEYVFSAPAVRAIGLDRLDRMHKRAKTGSADEVPGYSDGGYVSVLGARPQASRMGGTQNTTTNHYTVQVTSVPGMKPQDAINQGRNIQRGMQQELGRRSRNT